jgi:hypothetical protein
MDLTSENVARLRPGRALYLLIVAASWIVSVGCFGTPDPLPTGPSVLESGITIYLHANALGPSAHLTNDIASLYQVSGGPDDCTPHFSADSVPGYLTHDYDTWDDCISSVHLAPGWSATLYKDHNFKGASIELTEDAPNLQLFRGPCDHYDWNDCVSSIRVRRR